MTTTAQIISTPQRKSERFSSTGDEIVACNSHHEKNSVQGNGHVKNMTNIFKSLDAEQIEISEPENSFKAVCRVAFRHNLLMQLRWIPILKCVQTECGWKQFKDKACSLKRSVTKKPI